MNIFKLMQAMRPYIQRGDMTYDLAVKYLKERGVQFDGIVKKALDNMFKKIKARDPVFDKSVTKMPIDDAGIPFNPKTLKSTTEKRNIESLGKDATPFAKSIQEFFDAPKAKRGVENLFQETKRVNIPADKLNHQIIADQAGIDVELIKGKDWVEILEVLKGLNKADGGRIGYNIGGKIKRNVPYDSRASIADYAKAVQNVSGGTDAQKLQDIGKYSLNQMQNSPNFFKAVGQGINQHMLNNQMLRNAVDARRITEDQYKLMGGWDVAKLTPQVGLGNINIGGTPGDVGVASALYNAIKAGGIGLEKLGIKEKDPFNQYGDIGFFGSIAKNYQGAKGLSESDKALYESIISGKTQSDIDRFRSGLYAANQVDKATGDRLYGGNIENLYSQYKQSPSTFFYAGDETQDMYDRFNKYYKAGGRVGYDIGGLTGQAKNIYDSWISAGHSEEDVLAYLESRGLYNAPVIQEGIMTAPNIINQNLGGNGNDGGTTINRYDPNQNLGPNKDITDYEADAYGIGPTWSGQFARLKNAFSKIPTPFNIARLGIQKAQDWADQRRIEKEAAEAKAAEALQAQITAQANQTARDLVAGGASPDWGKTETRDSSGWERSPFKQGGLATMFTRRR